MPKTAKKVLTVDPTLESYSQMAAKLVLMGQDILRLPYQPSNVNFQHINATYGAASEQTRKRRAAVRIIMKRGRCSRHLASRAYDGLRAAGCL